MPVLFTTTGQDSSSRLYLDRTDRIAFRSYEYGSQHLSIRDLEFTTDIRLHYIFEGFFTKECIASFHFITDYTKGVFIHP